MTTKVETKVQFGLGVFILIFNRDFSKILLLKRNEEKRKKWGADWGSIGGRIESREYSLEAGIREAREEVGLELEKNNVKLVEIKESPNFTETHHGIHFIYATAIEESAPIKINSESDEYGWFDISNLPDRMIDKSEDILQWREKVIKILEN